MNEELRDEVAGVLGEHQLHASLNICTTVPGLERGPCDWRPIEGAGSIEAQHRNHQVDALVPLLERREREAGARALRDAADEADDIGGAYKLTSFDGEVTWFYPVPLVVGWLNNRADAITSGDATTEEAE